MQNPFHEGEREVQRLTGQEAIAERNGNIISRRIMGGALPFLAEQTMAVFGSRDAAGQIWASILFGKRGFMTSADGTQVDFDLTTAIVDPGDPFWRNIGDNPSVGGLAIELATRRRLRINGEIARPSEATLQFNVREAFPNCPKYINRREITQSQPSARQESDPLAGQALGTAQALLLQRADTLFIASAHPARGADVSHRGGYPGFVEVLDENHLRFPDYSGNGMFQTFGNLMLDPSAGLVVPDPTSGQILQLTGSAQVVFNTDDPRGVTGGTGRFLLFAIAGWRQTTLPAGITLGRAEYSPFHPRPQGEPSSPSRMA